MAPARALRPYSAPCGPFSTSICVMFASSWLRAFGFVCSTPSTTSAKFVSASRPVLMPRITTCMSPASAVCTCETFGVRAMKSWGRSMPADSISASVKACTVAGTSSIFSARWRAVTTTSGSSEADWAPAPAAAKALAMAAARRVERLAECCIGPPQAVEVDVQSLYTNRAPGSYSAPRWGRNIRAAPLAGIHGKRGVVAVAPVHWPAS